MIYFIPICVKYLPYYHCLKSTLVKTRIPDTIFSLSIHVIKLWISLVIRLICLQLYKILVIYCILPVCYIPLKCTYINYRSIGNKGRKQSKQFSLISTVIKLWHLSIDRKWISTQIIDIINICECQYYTTLAISTDNRGSLVFSRTQSNSERIQDTNTIYGTEIYEEQGSFLSVVAENGQSYVCNVLKPIVSSKINRVFPSIHISKAAKAWKINF